jgi:hypothetical protein
LHAWRPVDCSQNLLGALIIGNGAWPTRRFWPVLGFTMVAGVGYTTYSERHHLRRGSWAYSDLMPIVSLFGLHVGLSPLLQWIVIPAAAFTAVRSGGDAACSRLTLGRNNRVS